MLAPLRCDRRLAGDQEVEGVERERTTRGDTAPEAAPALPIHRTLVHEAWIDTNRHMNAAFYLALVKDPAMEVHDDWDYGEDFRRRTGQSNFVVRSEVVHLSELRLGDEITVATRLWALDEKRLRLLFEIRNGADDQLAALVQYVVMHIAFGPPPRAEVIPETLRSRLVTIRDAHARIAVPPEARRLSVGDKPQPLDWPMAEQS